jgi:hypothetical protein
MSKTLPALPPAPGGIRLGLGTVIVGWADKIPGIRSREYYTTRGYWVIPILPQTEREKSLTIHFLKPQRLYYQRWCEHCTRELDTHVRSDPQYEIRRLIVFEPTVITDVNAPTLVLEEEEKPLSAREAWNKKVAGTLNH